MIGDADPEDAWDDGDPLDAKLDILERVVIALRSSRRKSLHDSRREDALRLVAKLPASERRSVIRENIEIS